MEMRGDFLSQRSVKQTEGQNPIGRKTGKRGGGGGERGTEMLVMIKEVKKNLKKRKEGKKDEAHDKREEGETTWLKSNHSTHTHTYTHIGTLQTIICLDALNQYTYKGLLTAEHHRII